MSKFTLGPWDVDEGDLSVYQLETGKTIVNQSVGNDTPEYKTVEANARLIASAPELLEALITALPYWEIIEADEIYRPDVVKKIIKKIRSAIAKAGAA